MGVERIRSKPLIMIVAYTSPFCKQMSEKTSAKRRKRKAPVYGSFIC